MVDPTHRIRLVAMLGLSIVCGCKSSSAENTYPKDPLLLSKKPVEGKTGATDAVPGATLVASAEPVAPTAPTTALASLRKPAEKTRPENSIGSSRAPAPTALIPNHQGPTTAMPAVRASAAPVPNETSPRTPVAGTFGHAPDYTWLQGVLDKHYHGTMHLRYCDATVEDTWGGKVCLEADPRLDQFKEGDVILVEGVVVPDNDAGHQKGWKHYPKYQIREVQLVQRKN